MMEIKVRAWDKHKKVMSYNQKDIFEALSNNDGTYIYMLFAGLKDKNKQEYYDGDIIKDKLGNIAVIEFSNGGFNLLMNSKELIKAINTKKKEKKFEKGSCFRDYEEFYKWYDCEKIGNKFENPELLK